MTGTGGEVFADHHHVFQGEPFHGEEDLDVFRTGSGASLLKDRKAFDLHVLHSGHVSGIVRISETVGRETKLEKRTAVRRLVMPQV